MKIHWSGDPSKAPKSSFTKHIENQAKINKSFILGTSKTSNSSKSHRFYNVCWKLSCGNHQTVSLPLAQDRFTLYCNVGLTLYCACWGL